MSRRARAPKYEMKYYSRSSAAKIEQSIVSQRDHTVQVLLLLDPHHRVTTVLEFLSSIKFFCCTILDTTIENNGKVHSRLYAVDYNRISYCSRFDFIPRARNPKLHFDGRPAP